jgi:heme iron utilization protein
MDRDVLNRLGALLDTTRVLSLAVLVDGEPEVGLLPYALTADHGAVLVQASGLARHSRGLQPGAMVGVLIHAPDTPATDPMQVTRLSVQARVRPIDRECAEFGTASARLIARVPGAAMTLPLGDFTLYELTLGRGRYVEGFARAFNVGPETYRAI